jgi:hypothetical protein
MEIEQAHDAALRQRKGEGLEFIELAGSIATPDHGPDGRARNDFRGDAGFYQDAHDADMRPAPRRAATESQPDPQFCPRLTLNRCIHLRTAPASARPGAAPGDPVPQHNYKLQGLSIFRPES